MEVDEKREGVEEEGAHVHGGDYYYSVSFSDESKL